MTSFWKGKKVFITGHSGFKGSWLISYLALEGVQVLGYSLLPENESDLFSQINKEISIDSIWADIRDIAKLKRSIQDFSPDIVFHLAAQAIVKRSYEDPIETFSTNALGTANLLEACRGCKTIKSIVNVTTDKVYRPIPNRTAFREDSTLGGNDPYSASKGCSELISRSYRNSFFRGNGTNLVSARSGNVVGGGDWAEARLVPDYIRAFKDGSPLYIRHPEAVRPWQHVLDSLSGYVKLAEYAFSNEAVAEEAFNFAPALGEDKSVADFLKTISIMFPQLDVPVSVIPSEFHEEEYIRLDTNQAQKILGWRNQWSFEETIQQTIDWYLRQLNGESPWKITKSQILHYLKNSNH